MISLPSRSGRTRCRSSFAASSAIRVLEVVVVGLQPRGAALVAGGAVGAHQLVQPRQQRPGVGDVAPHRRVGPLPVAVAVEPQVQVHQLRHVVDHLLGVLQRPHPLAGHLRADHLVVVEAHAAVGLVPSGRRACRCRAAAPPTAAPDRRRRPRGRSPAAAPSANAGRRPCAGGVRRWPSASRRSRAAPPRRGRVCTIRSMPATGSAPRIILSSSAATRSAVIRPSCAAIARHRLAHPRRHVEPELRDEPRRPQHPQRIVAERHLRRGGRVEHPGPQRGQTAEGIEEFAGTRPP